MFFIPVDWRYFWVSSSVSFVHILRSHSFFKKMFRSALAKTANTSQKVLWIPKNKIAAVGTIRFMSAHSTETDAEFDSRYEAYFNRADIDGWEARKAMNDLCGLDLVPEPKIIIAALKACRRLNDFALSVRFLEAVKEKCGPKEKEIYPYLLQEIRPTLTELGISTPEELGYDKPELAMASVFDMHG